MKSIFLREQHDHVALFLFKGSSALFSSLVNTLVFPTEAIGNDDIASRISSGLKTTFGFPSFFDIFVALKKLILEDKFKYLSTADLIKKVRTISISTNILIGMLFVLLVISLVNAVNGRSGATIAVPFALSAIVFANIRNAKMMNATIKEREDRTIKDR